MNFFVYWKNKDGENELITTPLDGTILPGITRDSILTLCKELGEFNVVEKTFKIQEMIEAVEEGRLYEAFGAGTAALVSPVQQFTYDEKVYEIPVDKEVGAGKLTQKVLSMITDI